MLYATSESKHAHNKLTMNNTKGIKCVEFNHFAPYMKYTYLQTCVSQRVTQLYPRSLCYGRDHIKQDEIANLYNYATGNMLDIVSVFITCKKCNSANVKIAIQICIHLENCLWIYDHNISNKEIVNKTKARQMLYVDNNYLLQNINKSNHLIENRFLEDIENVQKEIMDMHHVELSEQKSFVLCRNCLHSSYSCTIDNDHKPGCDTKWRRHRSNKANYCKYSQGHSKFLERKFNFSSICTIFRLQFLKKVFKFIFSSEKAIILLKVSLYGF